MALHKFQQYSIKILPPSGISQRQKQVHGIRPSHLCFSAFAVRQLNHSCIAFQLKPPLVDAAGRRMLLTD